jgi:hypothetical protein
VKDLNKSCKYGLVNNMAIVFNKIELFPNESYKKEFTLMCKFMNIIHHIISMEYLDALIYLCNEFELINCQNFSLIIKKILAANKPLLLTQLLGRVYNRQRPYYNIYFHSTIQFICELNDNYQLLDIFINILLLSPVCMSHPKFISNNINVIIDDLFHLSLRTGRIKCAKVALKYISKIYIRKYTGESNIFNNKSLSNTLYKKESTMMHAIMGKNIECIELVLELYKDMQFDIFDEYEHLINIASSHGNPQILNILSKILPNKFYTIGIYDSILINALSNANVDNILFVKSINYDININHIIHEAEKIIKYKHSNQVYEISGLHMGQKVIDFTLFWNKYFTLPCNIDYNFVECCNMIISWVK